MDRRLCAEARPARRARASRRPRGRGATCRCRRPYRSRSRPRGTRPGSASNSARIAAESRRTPPPARPRLRSRRAPPPRTDGPACRGRTRRAASDREDTGRGAVCRHPRRGSQRPHRGRGRRRAPRPRSAGRARFVVPIESAQALGRFLSRYDSARLAGLVDAGEARLQACAGARRPRHGAHARRHGGARLLRLQADLEDELIRALGAQRWSGSRKLTGTSAPSMRSRSSPSGGGARRRRSCGGGWAAAAGEDPLRALPRRGAGARAGAAAARPRAGARMKETQGPVPREVPGPK